MNSSEVLATNICKIRQFKGLTTRQLSELLDMPQSTISKIENKQANVTLKSLDAIALALGIEPMCLIDPNIKIKL